MNYIMSTIITVFFQGNGAPRSQAAMYAGDQGLDVPVNDNIEHVHIPGAPLLLHNIFTYPELNDVGYGFTLNPVHHLTKLKNLAMTYYLDIHGSSLAHSFVTKMNIGGDEDVNQLIDAINNCVEMNPEKKIVLFGCSRGASTVVTTLAKLPQNLLDHIKLVIVEAPFDSVENVIKTRSWFPSPTMALIRRITSYDEKQMSPIDAVSNDSFPLNIPIAFIMSELDTTVPIENTMNLVNVLKNKNHPHLHELILKNCNHFAMPLSADREEYVKFVESLYARYIGDSQT